MARLYSFASTVFLTLLALFLGIGLVIAWLERTVRNRQKIAYTAYDRMRAFDQAFVQVAP